MRLRNSSKNCWHISLGGKVPVRAKRNVSPRLLIGTAYMKSDELEAVVGSWESLNDRS
jgi:hypothetical protein